MAMTLLAACSTGRLAGQPDTGPAATRVSGIDLQYVDPAIRPQDDLYRHLNAKWLDTFQLPPDKGVYGAFTLIDDQTQEQLHTIVDSLAGGATSGDAQRMADLYASFMDEATLEARGLRPLQPTFNAIDVITDKRALPALIAHLSQMDVGVPFVLDIGPDQKNSTHYAVSLRQSGLGLPDRDYYLKDDPKLKDVRAKYLIHVETMLRMAGDSDPARNAAGILKLETAMAQLQWTRVENRDPIKTYNKMSVAELAALTPGYDWAPYLEQGGVAGKVDFVIVRQPPYLQGLGHLLAETPLPVWQSYFKWHVLASAAPYLSKAFVDERFTFTGTVLRDIPENRPRWKRGVALVDDAMGEALGKLYVETYFPPESKVRMDELVRNLLEAYRQDIDTLDWMSTDTKRGAQEKLAKLVTKIGYPDRWRDYGALKIVKGDLWGNVLRANQFDYWRNIEKLGKPIDRTEWFMTPQTINAYYNPVMNEIVFPAAILQPPFFNAQADDAVNYGGIGAVIGHEISHGFDDKGSQYDGDGNLRDWFTAEDHQKFAAKTRALVAQYDAYESIPGYHINGELTLGENIGDNSGLAIAYKAYELSLAGRPGPVIDQTTGDQRFFLGWAQVWRGKVRDGEAIQRIKTDPHSPPAVRGTAPVVNQPGFYRAYGVKAGDKMYLPPDQRVSIW